MAICILCLKLDSIRLFVYQCWFDVVCVMPSRVRCVSRHCWWYWSLEGCLASDSEHISDSCLWGWAVYFVHRSRDKLIFWFLILQCSLCLAPLICLPLCLNLFASFCNCGLGVISSMVLHREFNDSVAFWDCIGCLIETEAPKSVLKGKKTFLLLQFSFLSFLLSCECYIFIITRLKVGFPAWHCFVLIFF